jgi:radical SAM protein with 4Fe4S-binding SPASM domain
MWPNTQSVGPPRVSLHDSSRNTAHLGEVCLDIHKGYSVKNLHVPLDLTIEVTKKCPLNCLICSSEGGLPYENELTTNQLKKVIRDANVLGTRNIYFSGGEPFEHPEIIQLCEYSKAIGLDTHIYTSGNARSKLNLLNPIDEDLLIRAKTSVDKIIVGLHGPNAEVHESITRVSNSFKNAIASIERAIQQAIPVEIHFVPVKMNYKSLPEMIELAKKLKVNKLSILRFVPQGRGKINNSLLNLEKSDIISLKSLLTHIILSETPQVRIGAPFSVLGLSQARCTAGQNRATIRADGRVFPCEALKQMPCAYNDLHTQSLREIWEESEIFRNARTFASLAKKGKCSNCNKFEKCGGGCHAQAIILGKTLVGCSDPYCFEKEVVLIDA